MPTSILITGGAGYVGSHTVAALLEESTPYDIVVVDNLSNAHREAGQKKPEPLRIVEEITGKNIHFYDADIRDATKLSEIFNQIDHSLQETIDVYAEDIGGLTPSLTSPINSGVSSPSSSISSSQELNNKCQDLTSLLNSTQDGKLLLKQRLNPLGDQLRRTLTREIATEIVKYDPKAPITNNIYVHWIRQIERVFPAENSSIYYTKGPQVFGRAHGRLFDAVTNLKAKYRRNKIYQPRARRSLEKKLPSTIAVVQHATTHKKRAALVIEDSDTSSENEAELESKNTEIEECFEWLRSSVDNYALCDEKWAITRKLRQQSVLSEDACPYLQEFPCLQQSWGYSLHEISCVIHFAALKAVGESVEKPLEYYQVNISGTCTLFDVMRKHGVHKLVYSSSSTVYGEPQKLPIDESHPTGLGLTSPYGKSKYFCEEIMKDICRSDSKWTVVSLRYFNPVGAHPSGRIGEDPAGTPNNLMPYISQVAVGRLPELQVYGNNYPTPDGTGVRDYIHVVDLAAGHERAVRLLRQPGASGFHAVNLGTGVGYSVLQMIKAFEDASGRKIPYKIVGRRAGDIAANYADVSLSHRLLGWRTTRTLEDMCKDTWRWQSSHPNGFKS